ncbi:energy-coupling factor ABC transporter ATP-binding protein [Aureimonas populi]|uniref:Energy-coupling factor ABC transporter ATP-binding protein n=1 Tax=Aureimonas populi TaxID=1701758 RepID=A0ABW5CIU9_9HYPH|nr:ABC transporter ATP-binding protein [Aureimonas populi]
MIVLDRVSVLRGERPALSDLSLSLDEPRVGVIGANGSGKSTFARLLNGLVRPSSGTVTVAGLDTATQGKDVRRKVGFLFQNPDNQIVYPTVGEDVAFGLKRERLGKGEIGARVGAALERCGLRGFEERLVHELSGGERQLVALAGILAMRPELLVLDEPTTLLDLRNRRRVMDTVEATARRVVLVTHDLELLPAFDRVLVFEAGRLAFDGKPAEALAFYRALVS